MAEKEIDYKTYFGLTKDATTPPTLDSVLDMGEGLLKILMAQCEQAQTWHKERLESQTTDMIEFTFVGTPFPREWDKDEMKMKGPWPDAKKGYSVRFDKLYPPLFVCELQVKLCQMARALDNDFRKALKSKKATIYFSWQTTMVDKCLDFAVIAEAYNKE